MELALDDNPMESRMQMTFAVLPDVTGAGADEI
jgi:hypothetical protein